MLTTTDELDLRPAGGAATSSNVTWQGWNIPRQERERQNGHRAAVVWLTGIPGAGKTTIGRELERRLFERGCRTMLLDGDQLRHGLCRDLGFTPVDRSENIRRAGEVARLFFEQGCLVLCAFASPYRGDRAKVRALVPDGRFIEVFVSATVETCRARDPKGLYRRAEKGQVQQLTGLTAPYEAPETPEVLIDTERQGVAEVVTQLLGELKARGFLDD